MEYFGSSMGPMIALIKRYVRWLHTQWPAGVVEKLPEVNPDGSTNVPGVYIVGDLTGIPLLKFSSDTGAKAVRTILADERFQRSRTDHTDRQSDGILDLVIIGAGVSGMAAALEAKQANLRFEILEASEPFSTIVNFPRAKPIYTYPADMIPAGRLQFSATVKEPLLQELRAQTIGRGITPRMGRAEKVVRNGDVLEVVLAGQQSLKARRVIVAIGRSGNFRKLGVPGEDRDKVSNRLYDPKDYAGQHVLVVGGGDSALETAIATAQCGAMVTLCYRKKEFSRPKPENIDRLNRLIDDPMADVAIETPSSDRVTPSCGGFMGEHRRPGRIRLMLGSQVKQIGQSDVTLVLPDGSEQTIANDAVFTMIGREAPLEFFRRSGIRIRGEMRARQWVGFSLFTAFCVFLYNWKAGGSLTTLFKQHGWFPFNVPGFFRGLSDGLAALAADPSTLVGTLVLNLGEPGFYYTLAYSLLTMLFGISRIRRRRTPYITAQTLTLMGIQVIPLFLLPSIILPYLGHNGFFDEGLARQFADTFFPATNGGHGREYWRAFGFVLAWPLFFWNVFTDQPMWGWLIVSVVQTFVIIPLLVYFYGKGAYCGWICSCGALAETLGDTHRQKMPHGAFWNRLNMVGQVTLVVAVILLLARLVSWTWANTVMGQALGDFYTGLLAGWKPFGIQLNYKWIVDTYLAGVVGLGCYFWFSGRVWCRFACPLAALMHIYARWSRFRIIADKKKCISCNLCTSVCHQGIDIMNFANKGLPMEDPQCVRCSACVHSCPTGTLQFGQIHRRTGQVIALDSLPASPVLMAEQAR